MPTYQKASKHANYAALSQCNSGGTLGTDTCEHVDTAVRFYAGSWLNIGSRRAHSACQDCVESSDTAFEYYGSGAVECYWTDLGAFRGWYPAYVGGESATSYSPILQGRGF